MLANTTRTPKIQTKCMCQCISFLSVLRIYIFEYYSINWTGKKRRDENKKIVQRIRKIESDVANELSLHSVDSFAFIYCVCLFCLELVIGQKKYNWTKYLEIFGSHRITPTVCRFKLHTSNQTWAHRYWIHTTVRTNLVQLNLRKPECIIQWHPDRSRVTCDAIYLGQSIAKNVTGKRNCFFFTHTFFTSHTNCFVSVQFLRICLLVSGWALNVHRFCSVVERGSLYFVAHS